VSARFVVVSDRVDVRDSLSTLLSESGYAVVAEGASVEEAIAKAARDRPDVILLDREVPDVAALVSDDVAVVILAAPKPTVTHVERGEPRDPPELHLPQLTLAQGAARKVRLVQPDGGTVDPGTREALAGLGAAFAELGWPYQEQDDVPVLLSELEGPAGRWTFYAHVSSEHDVVVFYSVCPVIVPEERRVDAADFLTWVNHGLAHGNFELDFESGDVRFKTVMPLEGSRISADVVRNLVRANGIAVETYLDDLSALASGKLARSG
jgi:hypothetical protein